MKRSLELQLRDLKCFETVATVGNLARAGEVLGRTQPAMTRSMQRLEQAFDGPLFERAGRGVLLTPVGEVLLERARRMAPPLGAMPDEHLDFNRSHEQHVRVGSGPTPVDDVLPDVIGQLLAQSRGLTLQITVAPSVELRERLRRGQLDLLLGAGPAAADEFAFSPLVEDAVVVAAVSAHPIFELPTLTLASLLGCAWALPAVSNPARDWLDAVFLRRGLPPPTVQIEANSIPMIPRLLARTELLGFVSRHAMGRGRRRGLREVPLPETTWLRQIGVSYRRDLPLSAAALRLLELLQLKGPALFGHLR